MAAVADANTSMFNSLPANNPENVFAEPWNRSDITLAIENSAFHVHKSILTMQSPVFEAMLYGHFKEAGQSRITLENKAYKPMLELLKLFYPANMIKGEKVVICDENVFPILELADEFQAVNVIKQCIDDLINSNRITSQNVLQILPYAWRYHESAVPKLTEAVIRSVSVTSLKEFHCEMQDKADCVKSADLLLWGKFFYLDKIAGNSYQIITALLDQYVRRIQEYRPMSERSNCEHCYSQTDSKSFDEMKKCKMCFERFKKNFPNILRSNITKKMLWELLLQGEDILTASQEQSEKWDSQKPLWMRETGRGFKPWRPNNLTLVWPKC